MKASEISSWSDASEATVKTDILPDELAPRRVKAAAVLFPVHANTALSSTFHTHTEAAHHLPSSVTRTRFQTPLALPCKTAFDNKIAVVENFTSRKVSTSRPTVPFPLHDTDCENRTLLAHVEVW